MSIMAHTISSDAMVAVLLGRNLDDLRRGSLAVRTAEEGCRLHRKKISRMGQYCQAVCHGALDLVSIFFWQERVCPASCAETPVTRICQLSSGFWTSETPYQYKHG